MTFDLEHLKAMESELSSEDGVSTDRLHAMLNEAFDMERSIEDIEAYNVGKRDWQKLRDEISPISTFLQREDFSGGIRFPDDDPPDAWFTPRGEAVIGIEVTRALGRGDAELSKKLVREGSSPGFVELPDTAPKADFEKALTRGRVVHNPRAIVNALSEGISIALSKKDKPIYEGMWLLIIAPMNMVDPARADMLAETLIAQAESAPFSRVYVTNDGVLGTSGFRLK